MLIIIVLYFFILLILVKFIGILKTLYTTFLIAPLLFFIPLIKYAQISIFHIIPFLISVITLILGIITILSQRKSHKPLKFAVLCTILGSSPLLFCIYAYVFNLKLASEPNKPIAFLKPL